MCQSPDLQTQPNFSFSKYEVLLKGHQLRDMMIKIQSKTSTKYKFYKKGKR